MIAIPPLFDPSGDGPTADIMDMYFCSAPPPPAEFQVEIATKRPEPPEEIKNPTDAQRVFLNRRQHGRRPLEQEYARMDPKEAADLRMFMAKSDHFERALAGYLAQVALVRDVSWRWSYARYAAAMRNDARKERPANG